MCPFRHISGEKTVVCKHWLRGLCKKGDQCEFLHEYDMTKMPECYFYSKFGKAVGKVRGQAFPSTQTPSISSPGAALPRTKTQRSSAAAQDSQYLPSPIFPASDRTLGTALQPQLALQLWEVTVIL